jgi:urease alpha subunit
MTGIGLAGTAACSSGVDVAATVDTLTTHLTFARRDAAAAGALIATAPDLATSLEVVRSERTQHADALATEIDRMSGGPTTTTTTSSATTTTPTPAPSLQELMGYLAESQRGAAGAARNESGYRAGLLGSISAACAVELSVVSA